MENKYALLNYDMEKVEPTKDFIETQDWIDKILNELSTSILAVEHDLDPDSIIDCFYENLHYGSIQEEQLTGDSTIDKALKLAIEKFKLLKTRSFAKEAGIGDTATDECITYELESLLGIER